MNKETTLDRPRHDHEYGSQIAVIRSDLKRLQDDIGKLRMEVAEDISERLESFSEQASESLARQREIFNDKREKLQAAGARSKEVALAEVRERPFASVLAAASAGLAIGALAMWAQSGAKSPTDD